jgi:glutathione S-transferase
LVRIVLDELELDYEKREELTTPSSESRAESAPTLQVPVFWDGEVHLWESGLIVEYLLETYRPQSGESPPLANTLARPDFYRHDRLVAASIQTLGTSITTIWQMQVGCAKISESAYLSVCAEQLSYLLGWLEAQIPNSGEGFQPGLLSIQDIALGCHLNFLANRPIGIDIDYSPLPRISELLKSLSTRRSFIQNPILWWEPGVIGYAEDGVTPIYDTD